MDSQPDMTGEHLQQMAENDTGTTSMANETGMAPLPNETGTALTSSYEEGDLFTWHGAEVIVMSPMIVLGVLGNLLVFYIYHFRWRTSTVTLFKRMLAVLDLSNLLLAFPPLLYTVVNPGGRGFLVNCIFMSFVALGTAIASGCLLVIIAADRFMKLCLLQKTGIDGLLAKKLFIASVILACLLSIPFMWIFGKRTVVFPHYRVQNCKC